MKQKYIKVLFAFVMFFGPVFNGLAKGQNSEIRLDLQNTRLAEALQEVEAQSDYTFVYNWNELNVEQKVSVKVSSTKIEEVLNQLFEHVSVEYKILKQQIVLKKNTSTKKTQANITVSGLVTDYNTKDVLVGVSISILGTTKGTITDFEGRYTLADVSPLDTLVYSFIGYKNQQIEVNSRTTMNIALKPDVEDIDEVVVIGYGKSSKKLLTSSVAAISMKSIDDLAVASVDNILQGQAAGVSVYQNSGTPGGGMSVRIRGNSSITAGNQPLYVIDGVSLVTGDYSQVGFSGQGINAVSDLNPADIESISILKDASAAAIYGARASNGVVLITTKRGNNEKVSIDFNSSWGMQQIANPLPLLNASEYKAYINDRLYQDGGMPIYSDDEVANPEIDTNWLGEVFRQALTGNYELSISGGNQKTRVYASGGYMNQEGILIGTNYERLNGRVNVDQEIYSWLRMGISYGLSWSKNSRVEGDQSLNGPLPNAMSLPSIYPVYTNGIYDESGPYANPVAIANEAVNWAKSFRNIAGLTLVADITDHLDFNTKFGLDYLHLNEHSYDPTTTRQGAKYNGLGIEAHTAITNITNNTNLNYFNTFNEKHNLDAMVGIGVEKFHLRDSYIEGVDFPNEKFEYLASSATIREASASNLNRGLLSAFTRVKYNFDNKYLITANLRGDGSSKFGKNNRFGLFPSASLGWRLSEEDFFNVSWVDDLKLRISYGLTGNDQIPDFRSLGLYGGGANYLNKPGMYPVQLPNPDLKWETTAQFNGGLDAGFINNRLSLSFDIYEKHTTDLLLNRPVPTSSGYGSLTSNIGELKNQGIELGLGAKLIEGPFTWQLDWNNSMNRNEVLKLYNDQPILDIGRGGNSVIVGESVGAFYGYRSLGVDPSTGDIVFADLNPDGEITSADREVIGNPNPILIGGITNVLSYRGFTLNIFAQYSYGNDVFNGSRIYLESMKGNDNQTTAVLNRWQQPGDITDIPRATNSDPNKNNRISSRFIEDGSYLRVRNLTLSYNFQRASLDRMKISKLRLYVTAQNLWTITGYSGMDPEVNYAGDASITAGTDFFTYPQAQSFLIGINLGF